ncbi:MAG: hypothetical protein WCO63_03625 [Bacteroidota bacterium]
MEDDSLANQVNYNKILKELRSLDKRLTRIEERLEGSEYQLFKARHARQEVEEETPETVALNKVLAAEQDEELESKFGEYVLPWLGNIVLLFGIAFLMQYFSRKGAMIASTLIGYSSVAIVFVLSNTIRKSFSYLSHLFQLTAHVLLYYISLRLFFFSSPPLVNSKAFVLILLLGIVALQIYIALKRKSELAAGIAGLLAISTAMFSDSTHFMMPVLTLTAGLSVWLMFRNYWWKLLLVTLVFVYTAMLLWLAGNPLVGHPMALIADHQNSLIYLFMIAAIYSLVALLPKKGMLEENVVIPSIMLSGFFFSMLMTLFVISFYLKNYGIILTPVSLFCLGYAVLLKRKSPWEYATAFYAFYAFMAISVNLYGLFYFPKVFFLLSLQSLLVVSIALWFKSRIMVVMNTFLFVTLLIAYLAGPDRLDSINFAFAGVALITARILNWQKARLEIRSEMLRNTYLITAFFTLLYALFHAVPASYVTLSWIIAAVLYFVLSILIRNVKYRYMAMGTLVATAFYLFLVDLANVDLVYRIVAFLFLAIISIGVSVFYVRKMKNKIQTKNQGVV